VRSALERRTRALARLVATATLACVCGAGSCTVSYNAKTHHDREDEEDQPARLGPRPAGIVLELDERGATPRAILLAAPRADPR
jgi:hypothetical protein